MTSFKKSLVFLGFQLFSCSPCYALSYDEGVSILCGLLGVGLGLITLYVFLDW